MSVLPRLLALLEAPGGVSGEHLARELGVSRAAVWKHIEKLRALGLPVSARAGEGYRCAAPVEWLDAVRLRAALSPAAAACVAAVEVHFEIDSTSSELQRRAQDGAPSGLVCFAETQHGGRGRRGRAWHSPLGANLYFSVLWRFDAGLASLSGLSLAVGVALAHALRTLGADVGLKWPNDIVAGGRKLGGVLVEVGGEWQGPCHAVVGVGLNLRMGDARSAIDQPWTDLASLLGPRMPTRERCAVAVLDALLPALARFAGDGAGEFLAQFAALDVLAGREVQVQAGEQRFAARADGIDDQGRLRVVDASGATRLLGSAEVTVRAA
ncbi:MAG TPA: biotin--[acetyl-CoA-carboxylase] ligase [Xanthomonadales bacterium]|nr:biotin--[acetyl-CoA-carboxylase] ligase [Xanthomonadales bacterium]